MTDQPIVSTPTPQDPWEFYDQMVADFNSKTPDEEVTKPQGRVVWASPNVGEIFMSHPHLQQLNDDYWSGKVEIPDFRGAVFAVVE